LIADDREHHDTATENPRSNDVEDTHYDTVGSALLWTFEKGLGDAFTQEVKEAWTTIYTLLAGAMKEAAAQVEPAR
jgi:hemoglobin-like flavoprotein